MKEFHSTNVDLESFSVSIFVLGYAFGPLIHGPLSELYGRLILYHVNSLLFILANVACALSVSLPMLIVFRLITGLVGSCPLAIGPASVSDLFVQEERGKGLAVWNLPVLLGPAIGPLVGSYLSAATGWRWNFWFLAIAVCTREFQTFTNYSSSLIRRVTDGSDLHRCATLASRNSLTNATRMESSKTAQETRKPGNLIHLGIHKVSSGHLPERNYSTNQTFRLLTHCSHSFYLRRSQLRLHLHHFHHHDLDIHEPVRAK